MRKILWSTLVALVLWRCATDPEDLPKLVIKAPDSLALAVGDTTAFLDGVKTVQDASGRQHDIDPYFFIRLVSSDTEVVSVASGRRLFAKKPGSVSVFAKDENEPGLRSRNTVKVGVSP